MGFEPAYLELSLTLVGDRKMRQLNRRWRGRDRTTDVLSFPQWDAEAHGILQPAAWRRRPLCLGDVVVSMPVAAAQAAAQGHDLPTELAHLLVHGLLHLMGHDHDIGALAARRMRAAEQRTLGRLQIGAPGLLARQAPLR